MGYFNYTHLLCLWCFEWYLIDRDKLKYKTCVICKVARPEKAGVWCAECFAEAQKRVIVEQLKEIWQSFLEKDVSPGSQRWVGGIEHGKGLIGNAIIGAVKEYEPDWQLSLL